MFKDNFIRLCNQKDVAPTAVCIAVGLSDAAFSKWTEESIPRKATLMRIADYFGVSVDYLLGKEEQTKQNTPDEPKLTEGEKMLIDLFRRIPEDKQPLVLQMIRAASGSQE